jgi:hypothetical protein
LPFYEIPAGEGNHAIFAGALWMGGLDPAGNLKLAAVRFRQNGNDYWPGPLSIDGFASTDPATCTKWDKFFLMSRQMVETHRFYFTLLAQGIDPSTDPLFADEPYTIPQEIIDWPAEGEVALGQSPTIAPFADFVNPVTGEIEGTEGVYEPEVGDYPLYDLDQEIDCRTRAVTDPVPLFGDFTMYWVFNDNGNAHTESQGEPIGMEIQAQMFGFTTNDEINNMTFCNYVLINRGTLNLENTYFAQWVDSDLGNYQDDFIGCDVMRGLGYSYNGDNDDEGSTSGPGYGAQPPAIGVDFFEGPYQDPDGINNLYGIGEGQALNGLGYLNLDLPEERQDSIIDNERFGMRRFLFHNNASGPTPTQDPQIAVHYYNMMRGIWRNGVPMSFGGTGFEPIPVNILEADFMFPGNTDPLHWGTGGVDPNYTPPTGGDGGWTEEGEGNEAADRRFVQSAGPFILEPGEFNNITVGVVYARAQSGGPFASVVQLFQADDKAQSLFENCFRLLDGPDAPDLTAQELDKEVILYLRNTSPFSNNQGESYEELDPTIPPFNDEGEPNDQFYRFQGYKVYQLKNSSVSIADIEEPELARLVFQCDIRDFDESGEPIGQIINYEFDEQLGLPVPVEKVDGANAGITNSVQITTDRFASGDNRLINFKKYYFLAVAYGYNNYQDYNPDPLVQTGQAAPYIRGRAGASGAIQVLTVIPHKPAPEQFGTVFTAQYGDGLEVSRIEGAGNGGNQLILTQESIDAIMDEAPYKADVLTYEAGFGPINVRIVDPLNVKPANFELRFYNDLDPDGNGYTGEFDESRWYLVDRNNPVDTIFSEGTIQVAGEQIIPEYGISIRIGQYNFDVVNPNESAIRLYPEPLASGFEYLSGEEGWLAGIPDSEGATPFNWIRSGIVNEDPDEQAEAPCFILPDGRIDPSVYNDYPNVDDKQLFENIADGIFAPARLGGAYNCGVAPMTTFASGQVEAGSRDLQPINSVEVIITQNKERWSRVPVYEAQGVVEFAQLGKEKLTLRGALSVDKNGRNQLHPDVNEAEATFNGTQVLTAEDIQELEDEGELNAFLQAVNLLYPEISTVDDLIGKSFGMGYFPGFAIATETGERMNMAFAENSFLGGDNGRDMLWNPGARITTSLGEPIFGGEHYVYVFRNRALIQDSDNEMPMYDGGQYIYDNIDGSNAEQRRTFRGMDWIYFPIATGIVPYLSPEEGLVPGDVRLFASVAKPYIPYATVRDELGDASFPYVSPEDTLELSENFWYPYYTFNTEGSETVVNNQTAAVNALDLIDIVPNPYYAYSAYEQSRVDNRVKFVNLPVECKISIFTLNGNLIRVLEKDNPNTFLEWNLQNEVFIPIGGGIYLIHVQAPGIGERVLKFFCATRPTDLRNF